MDGLDFFQIKKDMAGEARGFLLPEVIDSLKAGLPVLAFGADVNGAVVGALGGALDGEIFDIVSFFVTPAARKEGVGTALIEMLKELLEEKDGGVRTTAIRASYTEQSRDNRTLEPFFLAAGFKVDRILYPMYYISPVKKGVTKMHAIRGHNFRLNSFAEVPEQILDLAEKEARLEGYPLPELGFHSPAVNRDLSFCIQEYGKVVAYTVAEHVDEGIVNLAALHSSLSDRKITMTMLAVQLTGIKEKYRRDVVAAMFAVDETTQDIILELFPDATPSSKTFII